MQSAVRIQFFCLLKFNEPPSLLQSPYFPCFRGTSLREEMMEFELLCSPQLEDSCEALYRTLQSLHGSSTYNYIFCICPKLFCSSFPRLMEVLDALRSTHQSHSRLCTPDGGFPIHQSALSHHGDQLAPIPPSCPRSI